jgi:hypothetical protein
VCTPILRVQSSGHAFKAAEARTTEFTGEEPGRLGAEGWKVIERREGRGDVRVEQRGSSGVAAVDGRPTVSAWLKRQGAKLANREQGHNLCMARGFQSRTVQADVPARRERQSPLQTQRRSPSSPPKPRPENPIRSLNRCLRSTSCNLQPCIRAYQRTRRRIRPARQPAQRHRRIPCRTRGSVTEWSGEAQKHMRSCCAFANASQWVMHTTCLRGVAVSVRLGASQPHAQRLSVAQRQTP